MHRHIAVAPARPQVYVYPSVHCPSVSAIRLYIYVDVYVDMYHVYIPQVHVYPSVYLCRIPDTDRASLRVAESRCASLVFARLTTLSVPGELRSITCKHQEHHTLTTLNVLGAGPRTIAAKFAPPLSSSSCVADALATASYQQQEHHV